MVFEMHEYALEMVDFERASHALVRHAGPHHEVLDEELAAAVEELGQRDLALGSAESICLFHFHPGQILLFRGQCIPLAR